MNEPLRASAAREIDPNAVVADTVRWLERAVIGLNLCPFAKAVHSKRQIHFAVSRATNTETLLTDLVSELQALAAPIDSRDTTLLIAPACLADFLDFNDFLAEADDALAQLGLEGAIQIASFHPDYRFAGSTPDDIGNATNRSPWPILHLLRESRIEQALQSFPDPQVIYEANIETLKQLGAQGWSSLDVGPGSGCRR